MTSCDVGIPIFVAVPSCAFIASYTCPGVDGSCLGCCALTESGISILTLSSFNAIDSLGDDFKDKTWENK